MVGVSSIIEQKMIDERKRLSAQVTPISVGNRVAPMNTDGLSIQQAQQKNMISGLYGGKMKNRKKKTEKKDAYEWDEGFGELYEKIDDRKVKNLFPKIKEIQV